MNALERVVAATTYKPGWKFCCLSDRINLKDILKWFVLVEVKVPDAQYPHTRRQHLMQFCQFMPEATLLDEEAAKAELEKLVRFLEMHEVDEWLRFDGEYANVPNHKVLP